MVCSLVLSYKKYIKETTVNDQNFPRVCGACAVKDLILFSQVLFNKGQLVIGIHLVYTLFCPQTISQLIDNVRTSAAQFKQHTL